MKFPPPFPINIIPLLDMVVIRFEVTNRALVFERTQRLSCSKTLKQAVDISA